MKVLACIFVKCLFDISSTMRRLLVTLYIGLVVCNICYGRIDRKCKDGDPNCVDFDYHYEEAAKEMVYEHSNNISFTLLTQQTPYGNRNLTNVYDNGSLKAWWKDWYQATMELHKTNPDQHATPLCKPSKKKDNFIECGEKYSGTQACIGTRFGTIQQCEVYGDKQFLIPICKERSSNRVITCGVLSTFVCYPFEENKPPIKPCHDLFRQICLSRNGSLVKCIHMNFVPNLKFGSLLKNKNKEILVWWKKGKHVNSELEEKNLGKESVPLCLSNKANGQLRYCNESIAHTTACFNISTGEIAECESFTDNEMIVPICSEVSSNRLQSCDECKKTFLCFPFGDENKAIQKCEIGGHQICLNMNGLLEKCINSSIPGNSSQFSEEVANLIDDDKVWHYWWNDWVSNIPVTEEEEDIYLCKPNEESENLKTCSQLFPDVRACVSAKSGKIDRCKNLNESDFPVTLCTKGSMNKIICCSDFGSAYLCFDRNAKRKSIRPCRSANRHLCLTDEGLVKSCSGLKLPGGSGGREDTILYKDGFLYWNHWREVLFAIRYGLENNLSEDIARTLCLTWDGYIFECPDNFSDNITCVAAKTGKIGVCEEMESKDFLIPLCREKSSRRIMACGGRSLFICAHVSAKSTFLYTCKSPSRQLCLTHEGLLAKCSDESKPAKDIEMESRIPSADNYAKTNTTESIKSKDLMYLCKNDNKSLILPCSKRFSYPTACLDTKNGTIQSCERIEKNHNIGLPVCIHVNTSKLFTCGEYSEGDLCYLRSSKMHPLKPCRKKSKNVCLTPEGKLAKCSKSLRNVAHYYDEESDRNALIEMEYMYFEYEQKNITPLCILQDKAMLKECTGDPKINFACLSSKNGIIHSCESAKPYNLSIPLCLQEPSKSVVTCGKFNSVNLCLFPDKKRSTYRPCNKDDHFVCFKNELISRCQENDINYRQNDRYLEKIEDDLKEGKGYQISGYQNSEKVYKSESHSIQAMLNNCSRMCEFDEETNELRSCEYDPSINFACFGVIEGNVRSCNTFSPTELIMPVCVEEKTKKVVTHGKFFKAYLCFQENGDDVRIQTCSAQNQHICLTKKGFLEKCYHNESAISSELRQEIPKGETNSPEQSTINSQFNANINETLTSKENETVEDNREEITDDDYTEKLKAMLGIKSNKKTSRVSKGKDKYKVESDKDSKEKLESLEKNGKKEKKQNKIHGDQKRKYLKKDYNNDKKQEGTKNSNKGKSKSRVEKSIKEFTNAITSNPSMDQIIDLVDEYEYHFNVSNEEETVGDETYTQDSSDIKENERLESISLDYQDIPQEEYRTKHREAIIEKELRLISSIHMISRHLCKMSKNNEKLIDCDSDPQLNFACVGVREGKIRSCSEFEGADIAFPICFQANSRNLVTCDIFSNVQLFLTDTDHEACLGEDGVPVECENHVKRRSSSMEQFRNPDPNDEKFYRLLCTNCSIENRFILEGEPKDVLPTLEVFTFPPK